MQESVKDTAMPKLKVIIAEARLQSLLYTKDNDNWMLPVGASLLYIYI